MVEGSLWLNFHACAVVAFVDVLEQIFYAFDRHACFKIDVGLVFP